MEHSGPTDQCLQVRPRLIVSSSELILTAPILDNMDTFLSVCWIPRALVGRHGRVVVHLRQGHSLERSGTCNNHTPQYAFEDFAVRQVALLLNKTDDVAKYTNRSLVSPSVPTVDGVSD